MLKNEVYFVYVMFNGNAYPQKWNGLKLSSQNHKPVPVAYSKLLTEQERNLTIDELCEKYPFEPHKEKDNAKVNLT